MIQPLHDYYFVQLIEKEPKGALILLDQENKALRLAMIISRPIDDELELRVGDTVYVQQHYGHRLDQNDRILIKSEYILAEYLDK